MEIGEAYYLFWWLLVWYILTAYIVAKLADSEIRRVASKVELHCLQRSTLANHSLRTTLFQVRVAVSYFLGTDIGTILAHPDEYQERLYWMTAGKLKQHILYLP